jgi:hypothetical protein
MARVTIYLPDYLHNRWRDQHPHLNLSRAAQRGIYEEMKLAGDGDVVMLCDLCHQGVAQAYRVKKPDETPRKRRPKAS